jgi:C1A family cysteine protease
MMKKLDPKQIIDINQDHGLTKKRIGTVFEPEKIENTEESLPFELAKFHWTPDRPDTRDFIYARRPGRLSNKIDLRPHCSPIENQGILGSCTGQAIAGAIELLNNRNNKPNDVSRLFIYYYERFLIGTVNYDSGAYIRDGIKSVFRWGSPLEKFWPYIINRFTIEPSKEAINDGALRKVTRYERITDISGCLNALSNGFPVVIGFQVYSSFESMTVKRTGRMTYPNKRRERQLGGHAVLLVGYDMSSRTFIARNSWGPNWGDRGYFYMPFSVIEDRTMSSDFWIVTSVNNP